jgi:hypothetical protein
LSTVCGQNVDRVVTLCILKSEEQRNLAFVRDK